ncbi:MAG: Signal recognition particle 19 kDa protein [Methanomassiliicoccales archaeon PtaU1.Bin124]|nr:MAG: Signal recognition particle 19 kDa protein [Methanomassiliicoccales archaeon PtaU1.Bin124]
MAWDEEKAWVLWPEYFDSNRSRLAGRKAGKTMSVPAPTVEQIVAAVRHLGLNYKVESDKSFPGNWAEKKGRVLVERAIPKSQLIKKVGEHLRRNQRS